MYLYFGVHGQICSSVSIHCRLSMIARELMTNLKLKLMWMRAYRELKNICCHVHVNSLLLDLLSSRLFLKVLNLPSVVPFLCICLGPQTSQSDNIRFRSTVSSNDEAPVCARLAPMETDTQTAPLTQRSPGDTCGRYALWDCGSEPCTV